MPPRANTWIPKQTHHVTISPYRTPRSTSSVSQRGRTASVSRDHRAAE